MIRELYMDLEYIPNGIIYLLKYFMSQDRGLYMGFNTSLQQFIER
jgi:hypothetical protein